MALLAITRKNKTDAKPQQALNTLPDIAANQVQISDSAVQRIKELLEENPTGTCMRVGIVGGGCSGFSYHYVIESAPKPNDLVFEQQDTRICIDPKSMKLIGGSLLEWHEETGRKGFRLRNKRETKSCSCGQSFSL